MLPMLDASITDMSNPPVLTSLSPFRRTSYSMEELAVYDSSDDDSDDSSYDGMPKLIDRSVNYYSNSSYSESDSDDETLDSYEEWEEDCLCETEVGTNDNHTQYLPSNGPDFDTMDIDDDDFDYKSDLDSSDDDHLEDEAYFDKEDLDPFTIIQELSDTGDQ